MLFHEFLAHHHHKGRAVAGLRRVARRHAALGREHGAQLGQAFQRGVGARAFVDLMLSEDVQAGIPESMYMYPASSAVELPEEWARWAKTAEQPLTVDPATIEEQRETWLREWTDITS